MPTNAVRAYPKQARLYRPLYVAPARGIKRKEKDRDPYTT